MDLLRREPAGFADDDPVPFFVPLQHGPGANAELLTDFGGDRNLSLPWPFATQQLKNDIVTVVRELKTRFPNLRVAYLSSRIYAGYATTTLNPEPYSGFAVRWVIEDQLNGLLPFEGSAAVAPWLAWGPYLWADGLTPRADGVTWACPDLADDGTHPGASGRQKVAGLLLDFVRTDPTAREWFVGP